MATKEEFIEIYQQYIHREGSEELLDYLVNKSDFFISFSLFFLILTNKPF